MSENMNICSITVLPSFPRVLPCRLGPPAPSSDWWTAHTPAGCAGPAARSDGDVAAGNTTNLNVCSCFWPSQWCWTKLSSSQQLKNRNQIVQSSLRNLGVLFDVDLIVSSKLEPSQELNHSDLGKCIHTLIFPRPDYCKSLISVTLPPLTSSDCSSEASWF